jgi:uncharacterized protein (DUF885 family)
MRKRILPLLLACAALIPVAPAVQPSRPDWDTLVDRYYEAWFNLHPTSGTQVGLHRFDGQLESFTPAARAGQAFTLRAFQGLFRAFPDRPLTLTQRHDRDVLIAGIQGELQELEQLKNWQHSPDFYSGLVSDSVWLLMCRTFDSPENRLRSVTQRERQIPALLESAQANLANPPRIFTEIAIQQLPGLFSFFQADLPAAFSAVKDPGLRAEFDQANQAVLVALRGYQRFLQETLLPASRGEFALGPQAFQLKLHCQEMVDVPLDQLLERGRADLRRNQEALRRVAAGIDPVASVQAVMDRAAVDHAPADHLLQAFQDQLAGARAFIAEHHLLSLPPGPLPEVRETPPFMRAVTEASMDTPGPFETSKQAFFYVTLPDPAWTPEVAEQYLGGFNRAMVANVTVHEAFPGHYVQFLWSNRIHGSKVRQLSGCGTYVEGWAHYAEQMMVEAGYSTDPWLRIGQLQDALLRDARFLVAIQMHTRGMTVDQARAFFINEAWQPEPIADMEAKRGSSDPMYLEYTLGKLMILKLRADYRRKLGRRYTLQGFHDAFLALGPMPIRIIRRELLGTDGPLL